MSAQMGSDVGVDGFNEQGYTVTWRLTARELRKVSELREQVFCQELRWAGAPDDPVERDAFDVDSTHIAVLDSQSEVIGTVRMIGSGAPWMLDSVFRALAPQDRIAKSSDTAEASRLAVHRRWRGKRLENGVRVCDLVYKAAYAYCRLRGIRRLYMVTSDIVLNHMQRSGLPCREIAPPRQMPDGVRAAAAVLDWNRLREIALADWYESGWQMPRANPPSAVPRGLRPPGVSGSRPCPVAETNAFSPFSVTGIDSAFVASGWNASGL